MSTTTAPERATFHTGDLIVITADDHELHGKTGTVLLYSRSAGVYSVKVLDGPVLPIAPDALMDAAEFWEREDAHR
jgi:hypothetical protein